MVDIYLPPAHTNALLILLKVYYLKTILALGHLSPGLPLFVFCSSPHNVFAYCAHFSPQSESKEDQLHWGFLCLLLLFYVDIHYH